MSRDGTTFRRARDYTPFLSALIHQQRLLFLEWALPYRAYSHLRRRARPARGHLSLLNRVRRRFMCFGCLTPIAEFTSLRAYGREICRTDGPSFRVRWSEDGQTVYFNDTSVQMTEFQALGHRMLDNAAALCRRLMFSWAPSVRLNHIKDNLYNTHQGHSFIQHPGNRLSNAYLQLSTRACTAPEDGLMHGDQWDLPIVLRYLSASESLLWLLIYIIFTLGGQGPQGTEFFTLQHSNSASSERGIYVYNGYLVYITHHHKAKVSTNNEFHIVRYLPHRAGELLYYYLVYIRPFTDMLNRTCCGVQQESNRLFCVNQRT